MVLGWFCVGSGIFLGWFYFCWFRGERADLDRRRGQVRGNKGAGFESVRAGGQAKGQREYASGRSLA